MQQKIKKAACLSRKQELHSPGSRVLPVRQHPRAGLCLLRVSDLFPRILIPAVLHLRFGRQHRSSAPWRLRDSVLPLRILIPAVLHLRPGRQYRSSVLCRLRDSVLFPRTLTPTALFPREDPQCPRGLIPPDPCSRLWHPCRKSGITAA